MDNSHLKDIASGASSENMGIGKNSIFNFWPTAHACSNLDIEYVRHLY